jgi:hypothetical protein
MVPSGMLRRVALVRTDVSEELSASLKTPFFIVTAVTDVLLIKPQRTGKLWCLKVQSGGCLMVNLDIRMMVSTDFLCYQFNRELYRDYFFPILFK